MSRRTQLALSLAVTVAATWYSICGLDLGESLAAMRSVRLGWLAAVVALAAFSLWVRGRRWRFILSTLGPLGDTPVFEATCIGFMGNMVLPLRAGEIIRPMVAARSGAVRMPSALATVAIERLL
ncbi:MAG: lysylphosphatidylglycerol synthase domain-containing protein, partial [Alphaproteobacteria bacterium]